MNRRDFVKNTALTAAAFATADLAFAGRSSSRRIGIQLYSVRDELKSGLASVLERLAGIGYRQIEMFGYNNGKYFGHDMKAVAVMLKQNGLSSPSAHLGINEFLYKGDDDAWKKAVDDAVSLGNEYAVVPYLDANYRATLDDYKKLAGRMNRAAEICQSAGMKFAYHNHAFEFEDKGGQSGYDILLKETDADKVKMEMDLFWVRNAGKDPIALFKANPGRFTLWHVKDMDKKNKDLQTEVGNGSIDFKAIFSEKKLSGMKYFYVEQENYDISPYDSVEKCFKYVKNNLG